MVADPPTLSTGGEMDTSIFGFLAFGLADAAILYARIVARRVHDRRIRTRLAETNHLHAVARASFAAQRGLA
jgi:hypothetical protein